MAECKIVYNYECMIQYNSSCMIHRNTREELQFASMDQ